SFNPEIYSHLDEEIAFYDLSEIYFDASIVPPDWYGGGNIIERLQKKQRSESGDILTGLARTLDKVPENSLIVMDSLTDIAPPLAEGEGWHALIALLRGLQRASKRWNTTIYLLLTSGILDRSREIEIIDSVDAAICFGWEETGAQRRQRVMYFEKFQGVMPYLEDKNLVKFAARISAAGGFEVQNIRVIV
ncbi:MAG: hypothetical protein GX216_09260, partial [Methanomicrobiales archaeon]|nr:hypothetical protein [Methanomicrobiales archaeon]